MKKKIYLVFLVCFVAFKNFSVFESKDYLTPIIVLGLGLWFNNKINATKEEIKNSELIKDVSEGFKDARIIIGTPAKDGKQNTIAEVVQQLVPAIGEIPKDASDATVFGILKDLKVIKNAYGVFLGMACVISLFYALRIAFMLHKKYVVHKNERVAEEALTSFKKKRSPK